MYKNSLFDLNVMKEENKKRVASNTMNIVEMFKPKKKEKKEKEDKLPEIKEKKEPKPPKKLNIQVKELKKEIVQHKKESPKKIRKIVKEVMGIPMKKEPKVKKEKVIEEVEKPKLSALGEVQRIRKENNLSLKDAWAKFKEQI